MSDIIDQYYTITDPTEGLYKEKGSKFISYAFSVRNEEEVEERLLEVRDLHHKARHHCFAYQIGIDGNRYRANDDGEPSGTAGKPILGQLHSYEVTDVLVVVVRYFKSLELDILDKSFTDSCEVTVNIRLSQQAQLIERLKAVLLEVSLEQIDEETEVPFCKIERLESKV